MGKWVSSRVDLGYTELLCIPEVTAVFRSSCDSSLGTHSCSIKHIGAPYVFDWEHGNTLQPMQGPRASSPTEGDDSWISRVVAGTSGIFSSYNGDCHLKLHFVQRSQDSCLVRTDSSGI